MSSLAGREAVEIAASPETVWQYRLDFTNLPQYNPAVSGLIREREGSGVGGVAGVGATYRFTLMTTHGEQPVTLETTGVEEAHCVAASMTGAMAANETFEVTEVDGGARAELTLWVELPDGLDGARAEAALEHGRDEIRRELDLMKHNLEAIDIA